MKRGRKLTGRQERRREQLLNDLKARRGYGKLKEAALHRILKRSSFGRSYGLVARHAKK
jgi:hypothetical protein